MDLLASILTAPFDYLLEPGKRLFWGFLLTSLLLASITVAIHQQRFDMKAQLGALLNRRYWLHPSSRTDITLLLVNNAFRVAILIPLLGSHLAATIFFGSLLQTQFGDAPSIALPLLAIGALYTLVFFIAEDLSRFCLHLGLHKIPWLWSIHTVHHSATNLTPLTVHRVHPIEMTLYYLRGLLVFGSISGLFIYFFGSEVHGWQILGVDCLGFLFNVFGANLRHSPIRLSFGLVERWFISPAQHQIHHSVLAEHHDKNFGTCLALWDRLLGSWVPAKHPGPIAFGLRTNKQSMPSTVSTTTSLAS